MAEFVYLLCTNDDSNSLIQSSQHQLRHEHADDTGEQRSRTRTAGGRGLTTSGRGCKGGRVGAAGDDALSDDLGVLLDVEAGVEVTVDGSTHRSVAVGVGPGLDRGGRRRAHVLNAAVALLDACLDSVDLRVFCRTGARRDSRVVLVLTAS